MPKFAIITSGDLVREGRWDATFHIALHEVRDRVEELRGKLTAEEVKEKLDLIALADKKPLMVLTRGTKLFNNATIEAVVKEYPHLSLALMEKNLEPALERIRKQIADNQIHLDALLALQDGAGTCQRCETSLDAEGFCRDETCPFSDVNQDDPKGWAGHPDRDPNAAA